MIRPVLAQQAGSALTTPTPVAVALPVITAATSTPHAGAGFRQRHRAAGDCRRRDRGQFTGDLRAGRRNTASHDGSDRDDSHGDADHHTRHHRNDERQDHGDRGGGPDRCHTCGSVGNHSRYVSGQRRGVDDSRCRNRARHGENIEDNGLRDRGSRDGDNGFNHRLRAERSDTTISRHRKPETANRGCDRYPPRPPHRSRPAQHPPMNTPRPPAQRMPAPRHRTTRLPRPHDPAADHDNGNDIRQFADRHRGDGRGGAAERIGGPDRRLGQERQEQFRNPLDPAELGRIDVRIDIDSNGQVTSHLTVEKPETLSMLRQDAPQLQRALDDAGLKTGNNGLQFSLRDQSSGQNSGGDTPRNAQRLVISDDDTMPASVAGRTYGRSLGSSSGVRHQGLRRQS